MRVTTLLSLQMINRLVSGRNVTCQITSSLADTKCNLSGTTHTTQPAESFDGCSLGSGTPKTRFALLDTDGLPFSVKDGKVVKAAYSNTQITEFHFSSTGGNQGRYDLMVNDKYVAVNLNGSILMKDRSTGQRYVDDGTDVYITSLFNYTCSGELKYGLSGIVPFEFGFAASDGHLHAQPILDLYKPPSKVPGQLEKRIPNPDTRKRIAQQKILSAMSRTKPFVAISTHNFKKGDRQPQRCPRFPRGIGVYPLPGAREPKFDGCGTKHGIGRLVPDLDFRACCNEHDLCYDNCNESFVSCNDKFSKCMHDKCHEKYRGFWNAIPQGLCKLMGKVYGSFVRDFGMGSYSGGTLERCICRCPSGETDCNGKCIPVLQDPKNCGACGHACDSSICEQGRCFMNSTLPLPPATKDPCAATNRYDFYYPAGFSADSIKEVERDHFRGWNESSVSAIDDPAVIEANEYACCRRCFDTKNCIVYSTEVSEGKHNCYLVTQLNSTTKGKWDPPRPHQCPLGGMTLYFPSPAGSGGEYDIGHWGNQNPGPCAVGF